jgi:hypothetical protein
MTPITKVNRNPRKNSCQSDISAPSPQRSPLDAKRKWLRDGFSRPLSRWPFRLQRRHAATHAIKATNKAAAPKMPRKTNAILRMSPKDTDTACIDRATRAISLGNFPEGQTSQIQKEFQLTPSDRSASPDHRRELRPRATFSISRLPSMRPRRQEKRKSSVRQRQAARRAVA